MSVNRAEFSVAVKSTFDSAGTDSAKSAYAALAAQLKAMQADISNAQHTGVSIPQESLDQLSKLEKAVAAFGNVAHEGGIKTHEVKEALHLVRDAAGDALGPIGQLGHFLGNPYVLAAAGAIAAIKMLVDQYDQLRERTLKQITASRELTDLFREGATDAALSAAASANAYAVRVAHANDNVDLLTESLRRQIEALHAQVDAVNDLATAQERLNVARIEEQRLLGNITDPEAAYRTEMARRAARAAHDAATDAAGHQEATDTRSAAAREASESASAAGRATGVDAAAVQHVQNMVNDATGLTDKAKTALDDAKTRLDAAKADLAHPSVATKARALVLSGGLPEFLTHQLQKITQQEMADATQAHEVASASYEAQKAKLAQYNRDLAVAQANQDRDTNESIEKKKKAEEMLRQAGEIDTRVNNAAAARAPVEAADDALYRQNRINKLLQAQNTRQLTPEEQAELRGLATVGHTGGVNPRTHQWEPAQTDASGYPLTLDRQAGNLATNIERGAHILEGQPPDSRNQGALAELQRQHGLLLGLLEAGNITDAALLARLNRDDARIAALEDANRTLQQRVNGRPHF